MGAPHEPGYETVIDPGSLLCAERASTEPGRTNQHPEFDSKVCHIRKQRRSRMKSWSRRADSNR